MKRKCKLTGKDFEVTDDDLAFYERVSPSFAGKSFPIPPPSLSPEARLQRRMGFRNESNLYRNKSMLSGKELICVFDPASPYKVLSFDEWWGDQWDPLDYGRDFDPQIPFFEQIRQLSREVPHLPLNRRDAENSEYTNFALNMKDCYLVFGASHCESCLYSRLIHKTKDVLDSFVLVSSELCYEGIQSENCYNCQHFRDCKNCFDSMFIEACQSCNNCLLCVGLHQKSYYVLNKFVGKEKFEELRDGLYPLTLDKIDDLKAKLKQLSLTTPHRQSQIYNSENCSGDMIVNSKNCNYCFHTVSCEDCRFLYWCPNSKDSYDACFTSPEGVELCYEVCSCLSTRSMGLFLAWTNDRAFYSMECHNNKDIFGCVGLKGKQYCILNKQYSKDQYERIAAQIAEQMSSQGYWGEFLPLEMSYFAYNETIAQETFPMSKQEVAQRGWRWKDEEDESSPASNSTEIPATIDETPDSITAQIFLCAKTGQRYRITPQELSFYRKAKLPIPRLGPKARYEFRMSTCNEPRLWLRTCAKTGAEILSVYSSERPELVYSNEAYQEQLY